MSKSNPQETFYDATSPSSSSYDKPFVDPYDNKINQGGYGQAQQNYVDSSNPLSPQYNQPINFESPYTQQFKDSKFNNQSSPQLNNLGGQATYYSQQPQLAKQQPAYSQPQQQFQQTIQPQVEQQQFQAQPYGLPKPQPQSPNNSSSGMAYENLISSPYSKHMPDNRMTPDERLDFARDYLQRYYKSFLNEQEQHKFQQLRTVNSVASGGLAILLPFTVVYTMSTKYNATAFYSKSVQCLIMMGFLGMGMHHIHSKQKRFQTELAQKYFQGYSDDQLRNFDTLMGIQRKNMQTYEEQQQLQNLQATRSSVDQYNLNQSQYGQNPQMIQQQQNQGFQGYPGFQAPSDEKKK
eukprot:403359910